MFKKFIYLSALAFGLWSCKTSVQPMYVNTAELASLNTGMSKTEVKTKLGNLSPFDILMYEQGGCEVHQYKYKTPAKMTLLTRLDTKDGLYDGNKKYVDESDAFLVYKNGQLEWQYEEYIKNGQLRIEKTYIPNNSVKKTYISYNNDKNEIAMIKVNTTYN